MSENKRYYWLKLKEGFFKEKEMKKLRKIAGGDTYTIIYLKILLLSLQNNGKIYFDGIEDDFAEEIALEIDEETDNVRFTIMFLEKCGLLTQESKDTIYLESIEEMIGSETASTRRSRKHRENQKLLQSNGSELQCNTNATKCNTEIDIDIEKEKELETDLETEKEKEQELEKKNTSCPEPSQASEPEPKEPPIITLTLNTKEEYPIYQKNISEWQELYPAVDIIQELRKMKGWCNSNPSKRKTKNGICRFINGWLSREQDNGGVYRNQQKNTYQSREEQIANRVSVVDTWGFPEGNNGSDDSFIH